MSSIFPQKLYWHIAGLIHPWSSVLEGVNDPTKLYRESRNLVKILKKLKLITKNSAVLDIGCGVGRLEYALAKEVKSCTGIDIAPSMIALAKKNVRAKNVDFIVVNGKNLKNLGDKKFDLIFSIIVFQHLPREIFRNYVKESYKHLKNGGKLFFQIPIYTDKITTEPPRNHPWAIRRYNFNELKNTLKSSGFSYISFYNMTGEKFESRENQVFVFCGLSNTAKISVK